MAPQTEAYAAQPGLSSRGGLAGWIGPACLTLAEVERYRREVQGTQGWEKRKQPGYQPNEKQRQYQRTYYQRRKAARKQPATEAAEKD